MRSWSFQFLVSEPWKFAEMVGARQAWVGRVVKRLEKLGYVPDDPLLAAAMNAHDALTRLRMSAHYNAVDGAGRKAEAAELNFTIEVANDG